MKRKNGHYYWVKRRPHLGDEGKATHPKWEPMLWDEATQSFHTRCDTRSYAPSDLLEASEEIGTAPEKRCSRRAWAVTHADHAKGVADLNIYDLFPHKRGAALCGSAPAIRVLVSWSAEDQLEANQAVRSKGKGKK